MTLLDRLPPRVRARARRLIEAVIREGRAQTPAGVVEAVEARTRARLDAAPWRHDWPRVEGEALVFHGVRGHRAEALALAEAALREAERAVDGPYNRQASLALDRALAEVERLREGAP
ncbi:MAG TPA: hypothetical protein VF406_12895 [Thermodesulfobacteriota bacterium]